MTITIHYEHDLKCQGGCGSFVNRIGATCHACVIKAEQKNAAKVKRQLRKRLDTRRYLYNEHGQPL